MEKCREKLRRLVSQNISYDSPQMKKALDEFNTVNNEWKRLEKEYLLYRSQFEKRETFFDLKKEKYTPRGATDSTVMFA